MKAQALTNGRTDIVMGDKTYCSTWKVTHQLLGYSKERFTGRSEPVQLETHLIRKQRTGSDSKACFSLATKKGTHQYDLWQDIQNVRISNINIMSTAQEMISFNLWNFLLETNSESTSNVTVSRNQCPITSNVGIRGTSATMDSS